MNQTGELQSLYNEAMNETVAPTPLLTGRELKDLKVLAQFTSVYCAVHHQETRAAFTGYALDPCLSLHNYPVCGACAEFLAYAFERRLRCPVEEKPACKHCEIHCFRPGHREKVREIMRFSGKRLIRRGRLDLLWRYLF